MKVFLQLPRAWDKIHVYRQQPNCLWLELALDKGKITIFQQALLSAQMLADSMSLMQIQSKDWLCYILCEKEREINVFEYEYIMHI